MFQGKAFKEMVVVWRKFVRQKKMKDPNEFKQFKAMCREWRKFIPLRIPLPLQYFPSEVSLKMYAWTCRVDLK